MTSTQESPENVKPKVLVPVVRGIVALAVTAGMAATGAVTTDCGDAADIPAGIGVPFTASGATDFSDESGALVVAAGLEAAPALEFVAVLGCTTGSDLEFSMILSLA